jgi:hypothetical protein
MNKMYIVFGIMVCLGFAWATYNRKEPFMFWDTGTAKWAPAGAAAYHK